MSFKALRSPFSKDRIKAQLLVTTQAVTGIGDTTATGNGTLVDQGTSAVTEIGVCWSTSQSPTTADSKNTATVAMGAYTVAMASLSAATTYYVRAYAINADGTAYGEQVNFNTTGAGASTGDDWPLFQTRGFWSWRFV